MLDKFGITQLNPTIGIKWFSNWDNGIKRTINSAGMSSRNEDPNDPMSSFHCESGNQFIVYGNGQAKLRGNHPRLYINKSTYEPLWGDVEITCYGKFVKPIIAKDSYTVFRLAVRSNHEREYICRCNGKGYSTEIVINQKYLTAKDGRTRKELIHPHYANIYFDIRRELDMKKWVGLKFVCKTDSNDNVLFQVYIDKTDGLNGGTWQQMDEFLDSGDWKITEDKELAGIETDISKCGSKCTDSKPIAPYNEKILRKGTSCYLRTDFVQDCYFKNFSIREI